MELAENKTIAKRYRHHCQICGKGFKQKSDWERHYRIHTKERPFRCTEFGCSKSFAQKGALTKHNRIHTGEKPFACNYTGCGRSFSDSSVLARHHRTHQRLYKCQHGGCTKSFNGKDALSKHELQSHQRAAHLPELDNSKACESALIRSGTECSGQPYNSVPIQQTYAPRHGFSDGHHSNGRVLNQLQSRIPEENHPEVPTLAPIDTGHIPAQSLSSVPQASHHTPQVAATSVLHDTPQATIQSQQVPRHVIEPSPLTLASTQRERLPGQHSPVRLPCERWDERFFQQLLVGEIWLQGFQCPWL
ncbi:hypothetical protein DL98DRAFT_522352 [Cadophora sp. DSE1049]|nr:hypothetical protein DL98DRAFT_522352 [Cadophora sp. DSE1049]